jgi:hypothetical protein
MRPLQVLAEFGGLDLSEDYSGDKADKSQNRSQDRGRRERIDPRLVFNRVEFYTVKI